jgi:hypothetical protein
VAVQRLTKMTIVSDKVSRAKANVIFFDMDTKFAVHCFLSFLSANLI